MSAGASGGVARGARPRYAGFFATPHVGFFATLLAGLSALVHATEPATDTRRSGFDFMSREIQAMQRLGIEAFVARQSRGLPIAPGAPEWIDLEAYLAQRAAGMVIDAPAVRA